MINPHIIPLNSIGSNDIGFISVAQSDDNVPFEIKRVYWVYKTPTRIVRGHHAHKDLKQILIAVHGRLEIELIDSGQNSTVFTLDHPDHGLFIPPGYWRNIRFDEQGVLLCLASLPYDEADYIRNFDEFLNLDKKNTIT